MRLVPVGNVVQDPITKLARAATDLAPEAQPAEGNRLVLHDGETVMLEVMNLGAVEASVSVLDLRSNGEIGPLFPHPLVPIGINENRIPVKNDLQGNPVWQRIPCPFVIKIGKPYGREVFKAIVTRGAADFSPLFRSKDAEEIQSGRTRGKPLGGKRSDPSGGETGTYGVEDLANLGAPAEDWATAEITFEALPPRKTTPSAGHPPK